MGDWLDVTHRPKFAEPHTPFIGAPLGSVGKNLPASARDMASIPGLGRSPGEENGNSIQYSCLGNPMDRRAGRGGVQVAGSYSPWGHKRVRHDLATI